MPLQIDTLSQLDQLERQVVESAKQAVDRLPALVSGAAL